MERAPRPDVLVDAAADVVAVRLDGRLSILDARRDRLSAESWLAADRDGRKAKDDLGKAFVCDKQGCVARLGDGTIVAIPREPLALADDCRDAALIVTRLAVPAACAAAVIDRHVLATTGAVALRRVEGKWLAQPARSPLADRPWYGRRAPPDATALARLEGRRPVPPKTDADAPIARPGEVPMPDVPDEDEE